MKKKTSTDKQIKKLPIKKVSKTKNKRKIKNIFGVDEVKKHINTACNRIKKEVIPRIKALDERDKLQYDATTKIILDANSLFTVRQGIMEKSVDRVKTELDDIVHNQEKIIGGLTDSLNSIHTKMDDHIKSENKTRADFKQILDEIKYDGTNLIRELNNRLNNVQVNGCTYPLNEAMHHIYEQHVQTHKKLDDVVVLLEPLKARKRWIKSTHELIKKHGLLRFIFTTKIGIISGTIIFLLILNTIMLDVFGVHFDLVSTFKWLISLGTR